MREWLMRPVAKSFFSILVIYSACCAIVLRCLDNLLGGLDNIPHGEALAWAICLGISILGVFETEWLFDREKQS